MFKSVAILCLLALGASAYPQVRNWQNQAVAQAVVRPAQVARTVKNVVDQKPVTQAVVPAVRSSNQEEIQILRSELDVSPESYSYNYETGNGIAAEAFGSLKKVDNTDVIVTHGSYRYTAPDGTPVVVNYVADENGFQPQGDHLPVAPPIPEAIARSITYIQEHPSKDNIVSKRF